MKKIIVSSAMLFSLIFISGCGPGQLFGPTATPRPTPTITLTPQPVSYKMNEVIQGNDWIFSVKSAEICGTEIGDMYKTLTITSGDDYLLLVKVSIKNLSSDTDPPKGFSLPVLVKGDDGNSYQCSYVYMGMGIFANCESAVDLGIWLITSKNNSAGWQSVDFQYIFKIPNQLSINEFIFPNYSPVLLNIATPKSSCKIS